ncbi:MAG: phosphate-starvation-inducible protein [Bacillales bacterium]|jgi:protein PsiE|nr:phosphate-starvation-inducible protein [Bacillales bacterium]
MAKQIKTVSAEERVNVGIVKGFTFYLNIALVALGITLTILMGKELLYFYRYVFGGHDSGGQYEFLERILEFFLYFEFIAMIVKYFKESYHFPLRYFLYLGITALTRLIIVSHDNAVQTLLFSLAILALVISLSILNLVKAYVEPITITEDT